MSNAISAVEADAYAALVAGVTLATVYQHVPQDTPPPVVIVADMEAERLGTKEGDPDRSIILSIVCVVEGKARKPLLDLQAEVETVLDGRRATPAGWTLKFSFQSSDGALLEDGQTYVGTSRFSVLALSN
jgi:hypothetical protein